MPGNFKELKLENYASTRSITKENSENKKHYIKKIKKAKKTQKNSKSLERTFTDDQMLIDENEFNEKDNSQSRSKSNLAKQTLN